MSQSHDRSIQTAGFPRRIAGALLGLALLGTALLLGSGRAMAGPAPVRARPSRLGLAQVRPYPGETGVRPDTPIEFDLGPQLSGPGGPGIRRQVAKRGFLIIVVNEAGKSRQLAGTDPGVTVDAAAGLIAVRPPDPLPRYTWHAAVLRMHPDGSDDLREWLEHWPAELPAPGRSAPRPWLLWTAFRTGSDLHEPTRLELGPADAEVTAGETASFRLAVLDDYGLPAWDGQVSASANESGARLPLSAVVQPGPGADRRIAPGGDGRAVITCTDPEAEAVEVEVTISSPKYGFEAKRPWAVRFRPGAPAGLTLTAPVLKATVGDPLEVRGVAVDRFGNGVPGQDVAAEAWGSATGAWRAVGRPAKTGDDGRLSFRLVSPVPQYARFRAGLAAGPAAALDQPLRFEDGQGSPGGTTAGSGRLLVRALASGPPDLPLRAVPPTTVTAAPGAFTPGATVTAYALTNVGTWDPWSDPLPGTATEQFVGSGEAAADGSLALSTRIPFAAGDVLALKAGAPSPPPAPTPLHELSGQGRGGHAYTSQALPAGTYRVSLEEDSATGPERFAIYYYHLIRHNGYTEGVLNGILDTGLVGEVNGTTCTFTLAEAEGVSFEVDSPGPLFNYRIRIFPGP